MDQLPHRPLRRALLAAAIGAPLGARFGGLPRAATLGGPRMKRPIPGTGESLCAVGLGTWQVFDVAGDANARAQAKEALEAFARNGGELVDSSPMYGSSETVTGDLAAEIGRAHV